MDWRPLSFDRTDTTQTEIHGNYNLIEESSNKDLDMESPVTPAADNFKDEVCW